MTPPAHSVPEASPDRSTEVPWDRVESFVGQLTHDVRNGLNALELQLTFLGEISTDPEAVDEIKRIRGTLANLTKQLQAVRVSTSAVSLHPFDYPAADFFEDLRERFERGQTPAKHAFEWRIAVGDALLRIDPDMTMLALLELLANASHFRAGDAKTIIEAAVQGEMALVTLREHSPQPPAIPMEDWGCHPLLSTRRGAYGLGLFRVRHIVESQGGCFAARYDAPAQTLVSTVTLPAASPS